MANLQALRCEAKHTQTLASHSQIPRKDGRHKHVMLSTQIQRGWVSLSADAWQSMMRWQRRKVGAKFPQRLQAEGWEDCHRKMRPLSTTPHNCEQL